MTRMADWTTGLTNAQVRELMRTMEDAWATTYTRMRRLDTIGDTNQHVTGFYRTHAAEAIEAMNDAAARRNERGARREYLP